MTDTQQKITFIVDGREIPENDTAFYKQILPVYKLKGNNGKLIVDTSTGLCAAIAEK